MSTHTADYLDAIQHLPEGATLVIQQFSWDDYERLLEDLRNRPHLRVTYDHGRVEIMSPLPEHEEYGRFIDDLVRVLANTFKVKVQKYGAATWKKQSLDRGVEPDCCYYVANAVRVIGKREFEKMKPSAIFINTARGPIVDQPAMLEALSSHRIAGAGLDVFEIEPLPAHHPLLPLDNVVLTSHCAGVTPEALEAGLELSITNVWNFLEGCPTNVVVSGTGARASN